MTRYISNKIIILVLILITIITGLMHRDSFNSYFFQDDWFNLTISRADKINDLGHFFIPRTDVTYFKPLGMQMPFFILQSVFGINPFPFHIFIYLTHMMNVILLFIFLRLLTKKDDMSLLISFLYATSSVHFTSFYWFSAYSLVISVSFVLITLILFLKFVKLKKLHLYLSSVLVFILGLLSNELVYMLPIILLLCLILIRKINLFRLSFPYILITLSLYIFRIIYYPPPVSGSYEITIGKHILNNFEGYFLWSLNWPDEMKAQLMNFMTINPQFIHDFGNYYWIFVITLIINILICFISPILLLLFYYKNNHKRPNKNLSIKEIINTSAAGILWFIIGILPVLFFPFHSFSYLLPISLVGLLISSVCLFHFLYQWVYKINYCLAYLIVSLLLINWLIGSNTAIEFNRVVHWAPRRAKIAKELIENSKKNITFQASQPIIVNILYSPENKLALNDQDAWRIIFKDNKVITKYISP